MWQIPITKRTTPGPVVEREYAITILTMQGETILWESKLEGAADLLILQLDLQIRFAQSTQINLPNLKPDQNCVEVILPIRRGSSLARTCGHISRVVVIAVAQ